MGAYVLLRRSQVSLDPSRSPVDVFEIVVYFWLIDYEQLVLELLRLDGHNGRAIKKRDGVS